MFAYDEGFNLQCIYEVIMTIQETAIKLIFIGTKQFFNNKNIKLVIE